MKILLIAMGLLLTNAYSKTFAADCISQKEMTEIASHFTQFQNLSGKEFCYDGSQTSNLLASIMFMRKTAFSADMKKSNDELFSGRFSSSWYNYFIGRIEDMNVQDSCPKGVGAYVYGFGNTMYVCPMLLTDSFSALDRASVFMHEARHIDGYPHTTCSQGPRRGLQGACDERISDGGSYAVTVETYSQLAKYATDLHPALKAYSMASAVTYADEAFEVATKVNREEKLLIMTNSRDLYALDTLNANRLEPAGQAPALGHLILRAQHLILFPEDKNLTARYMFTNNAGEIPQSAGEIALNYNASSPVDRAKLIDVHIGGQWSAQVYRDKVTFTCDPKANTQSTLNLPGTTAVGILYVDGYSRTANQTYLMTSTGEVFDLGCPGKKALLRPSSLKLDKNFKRLHKVGGRLFALTQDGSLYELKGSQVTPIKTGQEGQIFEIAPKQSFQFLDGIN